MPRARSRLGCIPPSAAAPPLSGLVPDPYSVATPHSADADAAVTKSSAIPNVRKSRRRWSGWCAAAERGWTIRLRFPIKVPEMPIAVSRNFQKVSAAGAPQCMGRSDEQTHQLRFTSLAPLMSRETPCAPHRGRTSRAPPPLGGPYCVARAARPRGGDLVRPWVGSTDRDVYRVAVQVTSDSFALALKIVAVSPDISSSYGERQKRRKS